MSVMSIRIDDKRRRVLKVIASLEGKTMGGIIAELIDDYIVKNKAKINQISERSDLADIMTLAEKAFQEWGNDADEIYNDL